MRSLLRPFTSRTALHAACLHGSSRAAAALLDHGRDSPAGLHGTAAYQLSGQCGGGVGSFVDAEDWELATPLHVAAAMGRARLCTLLLGDGQSRARNYVDAAGRRPYDCVPLPSLDDDHGSAHDGAAKGQARRQPVIWAEDGEDDEDALGAGGRPLPWFERRRKHGPVALTAAAHGRLRFLLGAPSGEPVRCLARSLFPSLARIAASGGASGHAGASGGGGGGGGGAGGSSGLVLAAFERSLAGELGRASAHEAGLAAHLSHAALNRPIAGGGPTPLGLAVIAVAVAAAAIAAPKTAAGDGDRAASLLAVNGDCSAGDAALVASLGAAALPLAEAVGLVRRLLALGCDPNGTDDAGRPPLAVARALGCGEATGDGSGGATLRALFVQAGALAARHDLPRPTASKSGAGGGGGDGGGGGGGVIVPALCLELRAVATALASRAEPLAAIEHRGPTHGGHNRGVSTYIGAAACGPCRQPLADWAALQKTA